MNPQDNSKYKSESNVLTKDEAIKRRFQGEDILSWIERFCIYLINSHKCNAACGNDEHVIILHMNVGRMNAYYCHLYRDNNDRTRFCLEKEMIGIDVAN